MEYLVSVKPSEQLTGQVERAAASLRMTPEEYLRQALHESWGRWDEDLERAAQFKTSAERLMEKNHEVYCRLATWPDAE